MNFLFWNIRKNIGTFSIISELLSENDVDVCILAEFPENKQDDIIYKIDDLYVLHKPIRDSLNRVEYIHKKNISLTSLDDTNQRGSAKKIATSIVDINLIGCHLPSKYSNDPTQQKYEAIEFNDFVKSVESHSNNNTLIVGDFNMNPFEEGMVSVYGFNSVMDRKIAYRNNGMKRYSKTLYPYFYNPMWRFMGDFPENIPNGTYFYDKKYPVPYYWHILDQVLIRPSLIKYFDDNSLSIMSKSKKYKFFKKGKIDKSISDHLPIYFTLNI